MTEEEFRQKLIKIEEDYPDYLQELYANDLGWVENHIIKARLKMGGVWNCKIARAYYLSVKGYFDSAKLSYVPTRGKHII